MLKLDGVAKSYGVEIFHDISFTLGNKEKVGLVGLNGCGKSTLMKIIAGVEDVNRGIVSLVSEEVAYLPQVFDLKEDHDVNLLGEFMESLVDDIHSELWKVERYLGIFRFGEIDEFAEIDTLSPGQKMKLYLCKLMMGSPTILLLDEPTNHLDIKGIEWLESFLAKFPGIVIVISHDREFLNNVTNVIFEIDEEQLQIYPGNYDAFVIEKEKRLKARATQFRLQELQRQKIEAMIDLFKKQGGGAKQAKKLAAARKRMEREVERKGITKYVKQEITGLDIAGHVHEQKRILKVENLTFAYPDSEPILQDLNLEIYGSETLWMRGPNGTGKSTLIKLITGELPSHEGEILWGNNIEWCYFAQNQTEMNIEDKVQDYFFKQTLVTYERSYSVLDQFMFDKNLRDKRVKDLSPGQKARLTFAIFTQQELQCLILDEPTNHLDIETKQTIEQALYDYQGTIILVSHDRYFASQLEPDRVITIADKRLKTI